MLERLLALAGRIHWDGWTLFTLAVTAVVGLPLGSVVVTAMTFDASIWQHLISTVFFQYVSNTLLLVLGVACGTVILGTTTAWLVTMYRFPGRRVLAWALLLPLAVPSYVLAFVITDQLEYAGTVQSTLRALFGWDSAADYWFPEIRSLGAAIVVLSLVLYPYVYLLARAAFIEQCFCLMEVGRSLGKGPIGGFFSIALPMARPAIAVGVILALMETLNEYGTVDFFAVPTITVGIFDVWLNMNSISGAAQLAILLMVLAFGLVVIERFARRQQRYWGTTIRTRALSREALGGGFGVLALIWCMLPVGFGFLLPAGVLTHYTLEFYTVTLAQSDFGGYVWNSLKLATSTAIGVVGIGMLLIYGVRLSRNRAIRALAEVATIGYAVPGAVLGIGILIPLGIFDNTLDAISRRWFDLPLGLVFSGSAIALVFGYGVRFMAIAYRTVDASMEKITPSIDGAARILGCRPLVALWRVQIPLVRPSILTAALLVFVDTLKELPLTLILRPFNFETLATFVYQYASDELLEECALGALTIVAVGLVPVLLLSANIARSRPGHGAH